MLSQYIYMTLSSHPHYHRPRRRWTVYVCILAGLVVASALKNDRFGIVVILMIWLWYIWYITYFNDAVQWSISAEYLQLWDTRWDRHDIRYTAIEIDPARESFLALYIFTQDKKRCEVYGFDPAMNHDAIQSRVDELAEYTTIRDSFQLDAYQRFRRFCRV